MDRSRRIPRPSNPCREDGQCSSPPPQPQVDPAQVATMQVLQGLVTAVNNLQQNQKVHPPHQAPAPPPQSKLRDFLSTKPPTFAYAVDSDEKKQDCFRQGLNPGRATPCTMWTMRASRSLWIKCLLWRRNAR